MTALIAALALIVGFQLGAGWVIERGYGPFLWGFTHPFSRRTLAEIQDELATYRIDRYRRSE